jgi:phage-related tail protein
LLPAVMGAAKVYAETLQPSIQDLIDVMVQYLWPILEDVGGWLGDTLPKVISILAPVLAGFATISIGGIVTAFKLVGSVWESILKPAFEAIGGWLEDLTGGWDNLKRGAEKFRDILSKIGDVIRNLKIPDWVQSGADAAGNFFRGLLPGHATGARNVAAGWAVVGERGPELVNLPGGSDVFSTGASRRMLAAAPSAGGASIVIAPVFNGAVVDNAERLQALSQQIAHQVQAVLVQEFGSAVDGLILAGGVV